MNDKLDKRIDHISRASPPIQSSSLTMKIFLLIRSFYKKIGLTNSTFQSDQQHCAFNYKNVSILFCMIHLCISSLGFFLFEANTIDEHAESFFSFLSILLSIEDFTVIIWKVPDMVKSIEKYEQYMEKSEFWILMQTWFSQRGKIDNVSSEQDHHWDRFHMTNYLEQSKRYPN